MEEQQRNIDEAFRKSLGDYREAPPGAAWQDIARRLDEEDGRRRGGWFVMRWPWVALSLLLIAGGGWIVTGLGGQREQSVSTITPAAPSEAIVATPLARAPMATLPVLDETTPANSILEEKAAPAPAPVASEASQLRDGNNPPMAQPVIRPLSAVKSSMPAAGATNGGTPMTGRGVGQIAAGIAKAMEAVKPIPDLSLTGVRSLQTPRTNYSAPQLQALRSGATRVEPSTEVPHVGPSILSPKTTPPVAINTWDKPEAEYISPLASIGAAAIMKARPSYSVPATQPVTFPAPETPVAASINALPPRRPAEVIIPQTRLQPEAAAVNSPIVARVSAEEQVAVAKPSDTEAPAPPAEPQIHIWKERRPVTVSGMIGYERSPGGPVDGGRIAAGARLLWPVSDRIALGVQPAFRSGKLNTTVLSGAQSYGRSVIKVDSFQTYDVSPSVRFSIDTINNYVIRESFDSIVVLATSAAGSFWELELPLLLNCRVSDAWYVYGGPSLSFGGRLSYSGNGETRTFSSMRRDSIAQSQSRSAASFNNYFGKSSLPDYNTYKASTAAEAPDPVRIGYLVGAGYSWNRVFAELSVHQQLTGFKAMAEPLQGIYSKPYFRFSVGYLLFKSGSKRADTIK